jgi:hypothetical protein
VVFSGAKMLTEQIQRGEDYERIERVASIIICGETLLHEEPAYYNSYFPTLENNRN